MKKKKISITFYILWSFYEEGNKLRAKNYP